MGGVLATLGRRRGVGQGFCMGSALHSIWVGIVKGGCAYAEMTAIRNLEYMASIYYASRLATQEATLPQPWGAATRCPLLVNTISIEKGLGTAAVALVIFFCSYAAFRRLAPRRSKAFSLAVVIALDLFICAYVYFALDNHFVNTLDRAGCFFNQNSL